MENKTGDSDKQQDVEEEEEINLARVPVRIKTRGRGAKKFFRALVASSDDESTTEVSTLASDSVKK